jgi:hypothetical protein
VNYLDKYVLASTSFWPACESVLPRRVEMQFKSDIPKLKHEIFHASTLMFDVSVFFAITE